MSSGECEAMVHQPSDSPGYNPMEGAQGKNGSLECLDDAQSPVQASGCECGVETDGVGSAAGPQAMEAGPNANPPYQHMYQASEMTGQPGGPLGGESPRGVQADQPVHQCSNGQSLQPGGPGPQAGMFPGGPQGQMPFQFGPNPMMGPGFPTGGPGFQAGMFPGGPQSQIPPRFGPNPMGAPHQPAIPGPQMKMHPGGYPGYGHPGQGYPGQMTPPHGSPDMGHADCQCHGGQAGGFNHEEYRHGQLIGVIQDFANGQPDMGRVMNLLQSCDTQFWKGALVGVAATVLLTNPAVKNAITNSVSGLWGLLQKEPPADAPEAAK